MIKKYNGFEAKASGTKFPELPVGGYVCKILNATVESGIYGDQLVINYDVAEGEYRDFWRKAYAADSRADKKWGGNMYISIPNDNTEDQYKKGFNGLSYAVQESNPGYRIVWNDRGEWDESTLKGKMIGIITGEKEKWSNDHTKIFTNVVATWTATVDDIRNGKYKIPDVKRVKDSGKPVTSFTTFESAMNNDADGGDLPF